MSSDLMEIDLGLDEVEEVPESMPSDTIYPCILLGGVTIMSELEYLGSLKESSRTLPMYISLEGKIKRLGFFEMTSDFISTLAIIGDYTVTLYKSETVMKEIKFDYDTLLNFVTIGGDFDVS